MSNNNNMNNKHCTNSNAGLNNNFALNNYINAPNNNNRNSNNLIDLISQQVTNNVLQILNNTHNPFINTNIPLLDNNNNYNNKVIKPKKTKFKIAKSNNLKKKNYSKNKEIEDEQNINLDRCQYTLKKRKENLNKFLYNYRYKATPFKKYNAKKENFIPINNNSSKDINSKNEKIQEELKHFSTNNNIQNKSFVKVNDNKQEDVENKNNIISFKHIAKKKSKNIILDNSLKENSYLYDINEGSGSEEKFETEVYNQENDKEILKKIYIDEIFYQKYSSKNYEISKALFKEIEIQGDGNCFYRCLSYFFYNNAEEHKEIRENIYKYISENEEDFYIFFEGNDDINLNNLSPKILLEEYIIENNKERQYAGDIEYEASCKLFKVIIVRLTKGYEGLNVFNIYNEDDNTNDNKTYLYILFKNANHFNYLEINIDDNSDESVKNEVITKCINNNLIEWKKIRKQEYPLSLKWYPEIYREIYCFYKYEIIPEERFNKTSNPRVYLKRFKDLAKKCFYYDND